MSRIGIIGLGFMGRMHYDTYLKIPGAQVVAVCDADPRRAAGDLSGGWGGNFGDGGTQHLPMDRITGTTDPMELIRSDNVDVVDICLPTPAHVEIVTAALSAGKHVLCEKPLANNAADARIIAAAAGSAKGMFMPAMCVRFWPEWEWLKRAVAEGRYGKVRSAIFRRRGSMPQGWFRNGKLSGGALFDLHVHDTDFIYHLFGKPQGVFSRGYVAGTGEIDHVFTQYLYDREMMVAAEGGWAFADGFGFQVTYTVNFESATADFDMARKPALLLMGGGKSEPVEVPPHDGYEGELAYFLQCVRTGQKPQRVTADDAVVGLQIVEAEKRSIETGMAVML
jgi:predicted dehydrogenase